VNEEVERVLTSGNERPKGKGRSKTPPSRAIPPPGRGTPIRPGAPPPGKINSLPISEFCDIYAGFSWPIFGHSFWFAVLTSKGLFFQFYSGTWSAYLAVFLSARLVGTVGSRINMRSSYSWRWPAMIWIWR